MRGYKVLFLIILTFLLTSCNSQNISNDSIKIGINSWTGYDPFIVAKEAGIFSTNGVDVEVKRFASTVDEIKAMKDGDIDAGGFTLDEVFTLVESGVKGKIVLIVDYSMGGDMIIGQEYIKSVDDLVGKTVGYEGTVVGEFLLQRALEDHFIRKSSVELVNVNADKWISTFQEKKVDALVCFNPASNILRSEHKGNLIYSSSNIPFEIIDVLFVSDRLFNSNKKVIKKVLKSWFETLSYIDTNLETSADIVSRVKDIDAINFKNGLKGLRAPKYFVNVSIMDARSDDNIYKYSQKIVDFMLNKGLLSNRVNTTKLFNDTLLKEVKKDISIEEVL